MSAFCIECERELIQWRDVFATGKLNFSRWPVCVFFCFSDL